MNNALNDVHASAFPRRTVCRLWLAACLLAGLPARPSEPQQLTEPELQGKLRVLQETSSDADRIQKARGLITAYRLSCQQVKVLARTIPGEEARIEFALASYPFTLDPQNFYEVYDVFESFSKVFRLHDQITRLRTQPGPTPPASPPPGVMGPPPITESEMADILKTVKRENFDDKKFAVAEQIVLSARGRLVSRQICDVLRLFSFDDRRLELAKNAYDCVIDPWNYHVVYEAFKFSSNREALSEYIQSRTPRR